MFFSPVNKKRPIVGTTFRWDFTEDLSLDKEDQDPETDREIWGLDVFQCFFQSIFELFWTEISLNKT